jgi:hypothetical protein
MSILFTCPYCGQQKKAKDKLAGRTVSCKACGELIKITGEKRGFWGGLIAFLVVIVLGLALFCGVLMPAITAAKKAARRMQCANNTKQLLIGIQSYHDKHGALPYAVGPLVPGQKEEVEGAETEVISEIHNPQLWSWRVRVLPFMENQLLYDEFRFDEPWDSEHNLTVAETMPHGLECSMPDQGFKEINGHKIPLANYVMVSGPGTVGSTDGSEIRLNDIEDGPSNTLLIVEVCGDYRPAWTEPVDITLDDLGRGVNAVHGKSISSLHYADGANVGLCDGSVRFLDETMAPRLLRSLGAINDGGPVHWD